MEDNLIKIIQNIYTEDERPLQSVEEIASRTLGIKEHETIDSLPYFSLESFRKYDIANLFYSGSELHEAISALKAALEIPEDFNCQVELIMELGDILVQKLKLEIFYEDTSSEELKDFNKCLKKLCEIAMQGKLITSMEEIYLATEVKYASRRRRGKNPDLEFQEVKTAVQNFRDQSNVEV